MVYCAWISELTQVQVQHLDDAMEPRLTPEQQAERDALEAETERLRVAELAETWGSSPEHLQSQAMMIAMMGVEEG